MEKDPDDRHQTSDELIGDLDAVRSGNAPPSKMAEAARKKAKKDSEKTSYAGLIIGVSIIFLIIAIIVYFVMNKG